ncbi:MAG TPA: hypothetical protein DCL77_13800 [Prolixibacteraceae bacterium]|jgi:hypothetical protein|nr:hypothetical protein [Prolixibacteraceae bacterium]
MSKKKKNYPVEPVEELTDAMHATFTISEEQDREHRVWSAVSVMEKTGWSLERVLNAMDITAKDFEKYKNSQPKGWNRINGFTY